MMQIQRWEYFTFTIKAMTRGAGGWMIIDEAAFNQRLNELGGSGWELVSVCYVTLDTTLGDLMAVLKRHQ